MVKKCKAYGEPGVPARPPDCRTGEASLCRNPEARKKVGRAIAPAAKRRTRESSERQCREVKVEQSRVPEGRHSTCDTVSRRPSLHRATPGARGSNGYQTTPWAL